MKLLLFTCEFNVNGVPILYIDTFHHDELLLLFVGALKIRL